MAFLVWLVGRQLQIWMSVSITCVFTQAAVKPGWSHEELNYCKTEPEKENNYSSKLCLCLIRVFISPTVITRVCIISEPILLKWKAFMLTSRTLCGLHKKEGYFTTAKSKQRYIIQTEIWSDICYLHNLQESVFKWVKHNLKKIPTENKWKLQKIFGNLIKYSADKLMRINYWVLWNKTIFFRQIHKD